MTETLKYFINRELSWLKFNERVLEEAYCVDNPLLERLHFLSIFCTNFDEFFMIRVGSLYDRYILGNSVAENKTFMTPCQQIEAIFKQSRKLYSAKDNVYNIISEELKEYGIKHYNIKKFGNKKLDFLKSCFKENILPLLSPLIIDSKHPFPHLENKRLYLAVKLESDKKKELFGIVRIGGSVERIFFLDNKFNFVLIEDILLQFVNLIFGNYKVESSSIIRVTRNADMEPDEALYDQDIDFRDYMKKLLKKREKLMPVRLEFYGSYDNDIHDFLIKNLSIKKEQVLFSKCPLDFSFISKIEDRLNPLLKSKLLYKFIRSRWNFSLIKNISVISQIKEKDVLLFYPYETMMPFIDLLREAANDNNTVSIKMTLYRLGQNSQIIQNLCTAAENGKQITVVLELRARFDEQSNIDWSSTLEESGCHVIYGMEGYKVHSKILLITRQIEGKIQYITQFSTGNYNEKTAKVYSDVGIITADQEIGEDAQNFFNSLTIGVIDGEYKKLIVAPKHLKNKIIELIQQEIEKALTGRACGILIKINSITDKDCIEKLVEAAQKGVKIRLIIRGICCLRPGIAGLTENIEIISIVGRFLEHSRVFCFGKDEDTKVFISSADLMTRNTERRVEIMAPVEDKEIALKLLFIVEKEWKDNVKARKLLSDGNYVYVQQAINEEKSDSQIYFCNNDINEIYFNDLTTDEERMNEDADINTEDTET